MIAVCVDDEKLQLDALKRAVEKSPEPKAYGNGVPNSPVTAPENFASAEKRENDKKAKTMADKNSFLVCEKLNAIFSPSILLFTLWFRVQCKKR